jgi:hypothetical protein
MLDNTKEQLLESLKEFNINIKRILGTYIYEGDGGLKERIFIDIDTYLREHGFDPDILSGMQADIEALTRDIARKNKVTQSHEESLYEIRLQLGKLSNKLDGIEADKNRLEKDQDLLLRVVLLRERIDQAEKAQRKTEKLALKVIEGGRK